jgi:glycosyltransferase involved in cell wall biosynthesis
MLAGRRILYASANHSWTLGWTFYQMLAEALASANELVYVDTPRSMTRALTLPRTEAVGRLSVLRTPGIPFQRTEALRQAGARWTGALVHAWARRTGFAPDIVWTYTPYDLHVARRFPEARVVYWTGDEVVIPGEETLLGRADAVLCVSDPVFERHRERYGDKVHFVPVACDFERYNAAAGSRSELLADLPRPLVGFSGFLNARVDVELIAETARSTAGTVVIVGPAEADVARRLADVPNVRLLGPQPPERVPQLIAGFDVALLPLRDTVFNRNANPVKFYEYLALGRPVVATDIPTLRRYARVASIGPRQSFVGRVGEALAGLDHGLEAARVEVARDHSFDALLRRLGRIPL